MATAMRIRKRNAFTGRWPVGENRADKAPGPRPARKEKKDAGGLARRASGNTKRGITGGQARSSARGRKRVIESRSKGGAYGTTAQARTEAR